MGGQAVTDGQRKHDLQDAAGNGQAPALAGTPRARLEKIPLPSRGWHDGGLWRRQKLVRDPALLVGPPEAAVGIRRAAREFEWGARVWAGDRRFLQAGAL